MRFKSGRLLIETDEYKTKMNFKRKLHQSQALCIEVLGFLHVCRCSEFPINIINPAVKGAADCSAFALTVEQAGASVAAGIVEGVESAVSVID